MAMEETRRANHEKALKRQAILGMSPRASVPEVSTSSQDRRGMRKVELEEEHTHTVMAGEYQSTRHRQLVYCENGALYREVTEADLAKIKLNIPVIGSLVSCENDALDHAATEESMQSLRRKSKILTEPSLQPATNNWPLWLNAQQFAITAPVLRNRDR
uniref:Uncharacterized protein n=1 Tax=Timema douglasi TaxID=61478 RepID=A0A7R8VR21_TIMDO|nr:unnamed protein product [Timema douglasi]